MTSRTPPRWQPSEVLHTALTIAAAAHGGEARKGTDIPYLSHLMAVSALVMEHGGTETQAAAALLHDSIEDTDLTVKSLAAMVGKDVAKIVAECSDTKRRPKPPWRERKEKYLKALGDKDPLRPSILVALADKVHNAESSVSDTRAMTLKERKAFFDTRFNAGWKDQKWWYGSLVKVFDKKVTDPAARPLVERLRQAYVDIFETERPTS